MDIYAVIRLIIKNIKLLIVFPILMGLIMYFLTRDQKGNYETKATIFTGITSGSSLNDLGQGKVDYFATKTAYNNLITILNSRNVIEETSLRLLSQHLVLKSANPSYISEESFKELNEVIPEEIRKLVVQDDEKKTYQNLKNYIKQDKSNFLYELLNYNNPHYSFKAISSIKTIQLDGSDIIELSYHSDDPGIAYHTLRILVDVFLRTYSDLKINQASAVIKYFEIQLSNASAELNDAEDRLLSFNKKNQIINYYEQTKHISSQQEKIEVKMNDVLMEYEAADAVLKKLEEETQSRFDINLRNKGIMDLRESLIVVNKKLAGLGLMDQNSIDYQKLKDKLIEDKFRLEHQLKGKIDSLYIFEKNSDGIAIETLLNDWLTNVIAFESAKARLLAMKERSKEFNKLYNQYAPLGAYLKRIEREIDVKEKSYLEILHHLGLARLKQQNEEMQANMKMLDPPFLPIEAEPTSGKMMVVVISVFTFLLTFLGIFAFELFDKTIKTPHILSRLGGINVKAGLPNIDKNSKLNWDEVSVKGLKMLNEIIVQNIFIRKEKQPVLIQVFSIQKGEGKSFFIDKLYKILETKNFTIAKVTLQEQSVSVGGHNYTADEVFNGYTYDNLVKHYKDVDVIFIEVPFLLDENHFLNSVLYKNGDLNFLVVNATRTWINTDGTILDHFKKLTGIDLLGVLNRMNPDNMSDMIGEIPKRRSRLRSVIKNKFFRKYIAR